MVFESNFKITEGINYELAKSGNEFELAKVGSNKNYLFKNNIKNLLR